MLVLINIVHFKIDISHCVISVTPAIVAFFVNLNSSIM